MKWACISQTPGYRGTLDRRPRHSNVQYANKSPPPPPPPPPHLWYEQDKQIMQRASHGPRRPPAKDVTVTANRRPPLKAA